MIRILLIAVLVTPLAIALGGCGQKGPLYLPDQTPAKQAQPAQSPDQAPADTPADDNPDQP